MEFLMTPAFWFLVIFTLTVCIVGEIVVRRADKESKQIWADLEKRGVPNPHKF